MECWCPNHQEEQWKTETEFWCQNHTNAEYADNLENANLNELI